MEGAVNTLLFHNAQIVDGGETEKPGNKHFIQNTAY